MALLMVTKRARSGVMSHLRNLYFTFIHLVICLKSFNVYEQLYVVFVDCLLFIRPTIKKPRSYERDLNYLI